MKIFLKRFNHSFYKAGEDCPQCKLTGKLQATGEIKHGDRVLSCNKCGWLVRENT